MTPSASEVQRTTAQLRRSYEGAAWHGPALKELLQDVNAETAMRKPIPGGHSIWELVLHTAAWTGVVRRALTEGQYAGLSGTEDFPPPSGSWDDALDLLEREQRSLLEEVRRLSDERLNQAIVPGKSHTTYVVLHGLAQHNIYHAGQIALLKKFG